MDSDLDGNNYLDFRRRIRLPKAGHTYRISALTGMRGLERVWMGIRSKWTGTLIQNRMPGSASLSISQQMAPISRQSNLSSSLA